MAKRKKMLKSYENLEFLHSAAARPIRVLCEFIEPQKRFKKHRVRNTIVFFGSARTLSREEASGRVDEVKRKSGNDFGDAEAYELAVKRANRDLKMSRYYEDARELAERIPLGVVRQRRTAVRRLIEVVGPGASGQDGSGRDDESDGNRFHGVAPCSFRGPTGLGIQRKKSAKFL